MHLVFGDRGVADGGCHRTYAFEVRIVNGVLGELLQATFAAHEADRSRVIDRVLTLERARFKSLLLQRSSTSGHAQAHSAIESGAG